MSLYQYVMGLGWSLLQTAIATFMAFDIPAGVVANSTSTAKRWYHREGYGAAKHFGFVVAHVIYPLLVSVLFLPLDWLYLAIVFGLIAAAALIVIATPLYLKRPVSLTLLCVALLVSIYIITPVSLPEAGCGSHSQRRTLQGLMLGASNDLILQVPSDVNEVVAIPSHTHYEIPVQLRMRLSLPESIGLHHIELDMMTAQLKVCPDQGCKSFSTLLVFKYIWHELLVQQSAARP